MRYVLFGMALVGWTVWNAAPAHAQPNTLTKEEIADGWILGFDGTSTTGWNIQGDAKVADGVLVLGGVRSARAQAAPLLGRTFQLRLEYRTEGKVSNTGWETRGFFSRGYFSYDLDRQSKDAAEWIEIIFNGEFDAATGMRSVKSQCRAVGEPAFIIREGGGTTASDAMSFAFEIPAGSKLYVRNVKLKTEPAPTTSYLWLYLVVLVGVTILGFGTVVVWKRRRRARAASPLP